MWLLESSRVLTEKKGKENKRGGGEELRERVREGEREERDH